MKRNLFIYVCSQNSFFFQNKDNEMCTKPQTDKLHLFKSAGFDYGGTNLNSYIGDDNSYIKVFSI
jgi:hypothetical protein